MSLAPASNEFTEFTREVAECELKLTVYKHAGLYACIVANLDPGATICRVSATTFEEAVQAGVAEATKRICEAPTQALPELPRMGMAPQAVTVARIELMDEGIKRSLTFKEFFLLPARKLMTSVLNGHLAFYGPNNQAIPCGSALEALQKGGIWRNALS
jgi:hypothetical protein